MSELLTKVILLGELYSVIWSILFFFSIVVYLIIEHYSLPSPLNIIGALFPFLIGYEAIYFINNYSDRFYDLKYKNGNLYTSVKNKYIYWLCCILCIALGIFLSTLFSYKAAIYLIAIYIFSTIYSLPPIRLKSVYVIKYLSLGFLYILKFLFCLALLKINISYISLNIMAILGISVSSFAVLYKNKLYKKSIPINLSEKIIIFSLFLILLITTLLLNPHALLAFLIVGLYTIFLLMFYKFFILKGRQLI